MFSGTSKSPKLEQLDILLRNLNAEIQCLSDRWRQQLIFIYCFYVDKMFDQKQRTIISYFSITDVGNTEYNLKTPKYLFVVITHYFPILSINC